MSKVKIEGHGTGTGTFTVTTPSSNTDRTITLPDSTGTLATTADVPSSITDNGDATAITIDSSENVLIGKTTTALATAGLTLGESGFASITRDGYEPLNVNRLNSDGNVISVYKDSVVKGSIAVTGSGIGIQLGGTAAANTLDDYEEGDWTPVVHDASNNLATMHSLTAGKYTKIGRVVTVTGNVRTTSLNSASGGLYISGLPFNSAAGNGFHAAGSIANGENFAITASESLTMYMSANSSKLRIDIYDSSQGITIMTNSQWSSDGQIAISVTYFAA